MKEIFLGSFDLVMVLREDLESPPALTELEAAILSVLEDAGGKPVSKQILIEKAWGGSMYATDEALKQRICQLRKKIPDQIEAVTKYGYRLISNDC